MNLTQEIEAKQKNKAALRRVYEDVFVGRDIDAIDELFEPDAVFHSTALPEGPTRGREEYKQFVGDFHAAFTDAEVDILASVAEGDLVVVRAIVTATHTGTFRGIPATGRRVSVSEMVMVRGVDGRCSEAWSAFDTLGLIRQLGLFPKGDPPRALVSSVVGLQKVARRLSRRR